MNSMCHFLWFLLTLVIGEGDLEPWYMIGGDSGGEEPVLIPSGVNVLIAGDEPR